ncbi:class I SAM-dependent methyltransferase [Haloarchaeobius iranensis]|uniref:Methyltransferase n=1 Tax=Haloarchaeobius iranensis TaxID=996166 RepID=A0A1G9S9M7_9EURY|nr:class I SAM-dependent methyltransferase family protein [Haloarchaeobius iranensis]SDM32102.1 methyltransferase [Haloarchaeobius iranensis]
MTGPGDDQPETHLPEVADATADGPLAAVVSQDRAEVAIASLRAEGVYDDDRRVKPFPDGLVALPVTAPPTETDVRRVVRQTDPEPRAPDLATLLRERGWDDEAVERAPSSWAVVGAVVLVSLTDLDEDEAEAVGEALLELHGEADTVCAREGVDGELREPDVRVVAGLGDTETVHVEHGTRYALDLSRVMFSPGNQAERVHMGEVTDEGERVLDMFAGIGYFALPMARAGATVTAVEKNPDAFRYLGENAVNNAVLDRMELVLGDCRDVEATADRVVMGYYDAVEPAPGDADSGDPDADGGGRSYLDAAFDAAVSGGTLHVHATEPADDPWSHPVARLEAVADDHGRDVTVLDRREVKSHSEGVVHVVVDARVD